MNPKRPRETCNTEEVWGLGGEGQKKGKWGTSVMVATIKKRICTILVCNTYSW